MRQGITQKKLAKKLNVSTATISKAFRADSDLNSATKAMILDEAAQMGYVSPTLKNVRVRTGQTRYFSVLIYNAVSSNSELQYMDQPAIGFLNGMSLAASKNNISLVTQFIPREVKTADKLKLPSAFDSGLVDGIILVHEFSTEIVEYLARRYPCVSLVHFNSSTTIDIIDSNHVEAMGKLIDHLYSLGHRRIGFAGYQKALTYNQSRFSSYAQAMARLGLPFHEKMLLNVFDDVADFDVQTERVIEQRQQGVTAWVCACDYVGYSLSFRLVDRGIKVPQEISITGYDGVYDFPYLKKPLILTTVRSPFVEMGAEAVNQLLFRLENPDRPHCHTLVECVIKPGETIGRCNNRE